MSNEHKIPPVVDLRLAALRRFALAISVLNVLGHSVLGFEMSYAHPVVALAVAYTLEIGLEWLDARALGRRAQFLGNGLVGLIDFLLPGHITALACAMLLYTNETFWPLIFAVTVGVCSKYIFRAPVGKGKTRHFFNPSNTGITAALVVFPWIGVTPPYQFTENVSGVWDWAIPAVVICTGSLLNGKLTKKFPLIAGWISGFLLQALIRGLLFDFRLIHALAPITGMAFLLFTFYMISDPGTTPVKPLNQFVFGFAVAAVYFFMDLLNMVYQIFFALFLVCTWRGLLLHVTDWVQRRREARGHQAVASATEPQRMIPTAAQASLNQ